MTGITVTGNSCFGNTTGQIEVTNCTAPEVRGNNGTPDQSSQSETSGTVELTFGGTTAYATAVVTHGLASTPSKVLLTAQEGVQPGGVQTVSYAGSITSTQFTVAAQPFDGTTPAANSTLILAWQALA